MKVCPKCNQTYTDDSLNFCLNDGAVLTQTAGGATGSFSEPPTVLINQTRQTSPNPQFGSANQPAGWGVVTPNAAYAPRPKSRAWLWVLLIFGGLILLCGGGFIGLIAIIPDKPTPNYNYSYNAANAVNTNANSQKFTSSLKDDLSTWKPKVDIYGTTSYRNNELVMSAKQNGYYFVLITPKSNFRTENATTRVKLRNTIGSRTQYGFGLLIHNDPKTPLARGYAFLIDTDTQKYRVVQHTNNNEKTVVDWTYLSAIKTGTQENVLEVKDENGRMTFYVNGDLATAYTDASGYKSGVAGLYVSDIVPVAFSGLEIRK